MAMAVQSAQRYPSNAALQPEYRIRQSAPQGFQNPSLPGIGSNNNSNSNNMAEYQRLLGLSRYNFIQQQQQQSLQVNDAVGKANRDETINLLGSRKRPREFLDPTPAGQQQQQQHHRHQMAKVSEYLQGQAISAGAPHQFGVGAVSTGLQLGLGNKNHHSQQPLPVPVAPAPPAPVESQALFSAIGSEVLSQLQQQRNEIDQYIRLQEEKVRQVVAEKSQQHSRMLLGTIEKYLARCLKERSMKVDDINRKNKELEERINQLNMETRRWQQQVRDYEGMVTSLRTNLQVVALTREQSREGCGDSEADTSASSYHDDDAHARVFMENKQLKEQRTCKICRTNDVCILLLPCQHLCLCKDCETRSDICPICFTAKDASFQVFMA